MKVDSNHVWNNFKGFIKDYFDETTCTLRMYIVKVNSLNEVILMNLRKAAEDL